LVYFMCRFCQASTTLVGNSVFTLTPMSLDRYDEDDELEEAHERRITRCSTCRARIIWFGTRLGKRMPVDADTVEAADTELDLERHISHFATCKDAAQHRRPR
jgi:hypothetical protein